MAQILPKNPLSSVLRRLGKTQGDLFLASGRRLERPRISVLCRELPTGAGAPKPAIPRPDTRRLIDRAVRKMEGEGGVGLPDAQWDAFAEALRTLRAPFDRRTNGQGARSKKAALAS